jgi:hypothetical protein
MNFIPISIVPTSSNIQLNKLRQQTPPHHIDRSASMSISIILIYSSLILTRAVTREEGLSARNLVESNVTFPNSEDKGLPPGVAPEVGVFFAMVSRFAFLFIIVFTLHPHAALTLHSNV